VQPLIAQRSTDHVGIEWADSKLVVCVPAAGNDPSEFDCNARQVARIGASVLDQSHAAGAMQSPVAAMRLADLDVSAG